MKLNTTALRQGRIVKGSSALSREGSSFFSYGTKIAEIHVGEKLSLHCTTRKYSMTTSKQLSALKSFYTKQGYQIVEDEAFV